MLATTPAARLPCADGTILDRLGGQLDTLPVREVHVVARTSVPVGPGPADGSRGLVEDLRCVAKIARESTGAVVIVPGDVVAHTEALASVIEHPARDTTALVSDAPGPVPGAAPPGGPLTPPVRIEHGQVVSAGSSFHHVPAPNGVFRGVLQVGEADLGGLAEVADELADLVRAGRLGSVTGAEVGDLILVGLVRRGVPVRASRLGVLHCERVSGAAAADAALRGLAEVDESAARLDAAIKPDDGFVATYLVSSWSRHLVKLAARLSLTPNQVTGISTGLAFLAAIWFSEDSARGRLYGAALLCLSFVFDCVDGQLARYTRSFSPLGAWLDATLDRAKEYMVYIGLAAGYTAGAVAIGPWWGTIWTLAVAAMILQALRHMIDFSYAGARADAARDAAAQTPLPPRPLADPGDAPYAGPPPGPAGDSGLLRLARGLDRRQATRMLKKAIVLPIGERMALIAVTAALFDAKVTFLALLCWGGLAAVYTLTGRIARSLS
ncbi:CDP-alcohol phosphatidyltransferase family protein [Thermocatellispora tengchongensis]|uniref:CDP-alcohol phosphatidyltransferase family protein n=1 Tax=Thermocatellispora tengchongensis TaxID=1073253 RepID=UPI00362BAB30